jgi:hypothetical protein
VFTHVTQSARSNRVRVLTERNYVFGLDWRANDFLVTLQFEGGLDASLVATIASKRPLPERASMNVTAPTPAVGQHQELVFIRELAEVYVLLDFISGRPDAHLWAIDFDIAQESGSGAKETSFDLYRRIVQMRYPPEPKTTLGENAYNATVLLYVKDKLNSTAAPARSMTIAYTYIYLGEDGRSHPSLERPDDARVRVLFDGETKASVARQAFPGLIESAYRLRKKRRWMNRGGVIVLMLAAFLLCWTVYGSVIITRFEDDRTSASDYQARIYTQMYTDAASKAGDIVLGDVAQVCCPDALTQLSPVTRGLCNDWSYYQARYEKAIADAGRFTARSAWVTWVFAIAPAPPQGPPAPSVCSQPVRISSAAEDSGGPTHGAEPTPGAPSANSANSATSSAQADAFMSASRAAATSTAAAASNAPSTASAKGNPDAEANDRSLNASFNQEDVQSIGLVLSVCSTYVLPLFFGVLGTIAKFLRDIANKTSTYTLSPRDENLFFMRLLLGAIAGIAVGLFYSPTASAHQVAVGAGILTLSASSFSVLAGYAADVFFGFLDRVVTSVFKIIAPDTESK